MAIFNSYVSLPEGMFCSLVWVVVFLFFYGGRSQGLLHNVRDWIGMSPENDDVFFVDKLFFYDGILPQAKHFMIGMLIKPKGVPSSNQRWLEHPPEKTFDFPAAVTGMVAASPSRFLVANYPRLVRFSKWVITPVIYMGF